MNNLKCRKQGFNKYVCKHTNKQINLRDCIDCPYKEYKIKKRTIKVKNCAKLENKPNHSNSTKLKTRTSKKTKLERERKSLFTDDLKHCIICGKNPVNLHEIFGGRNRLNSIKYDLVIPLCTCEHHDQVNCRGIHFDKELRDYWHKKGQREFEKKYSRERFLEVFKKNYL